VRNLASFSTSLMFENAVRYLNSETNCMRWSPYIVIPKFSEVRSTHGRTPENHISRKCPTPFPPKLNSGSVSHTLADCHEIWHDDATRDCGVVKIHFRSKPKFHRPPLFVRNSNSSFDTTCTWATCISKRSEISEFWNKFGEHDDRSVLPKFNEVRSTNIWETSGESAHPKMC